MKNTHFIALLTIVLLGCTEITSPNSKMIVNGSETLVKIPINKFGSVHNKSMNFILNDIRQKIDKGIRITSNSNEFRNVDVHEVNTMTYHNESLSLSTTVFNASVQSIENEGILIPDQMIDEMNEVKDFFIYENIHQGFNQNVGRYVQEFQNMRNNNIINDNDLAFINSLIDLSFEVNETVLGSTFAEAQIVEETFDERVSSILNTYYQNPQAYTGLTGMLISILESSNEYWRDQDLDNPPGVTTVTMSGGYYIIPAILARVIIKDAIGAITGIIGAGFVKRIQNGDWNHFSSRLTQDEALINALMGAVLSSGGFLGRLGVRLLSKVVVV